MMRPKSGGVASLYVAVLELLEKVADHLVRAKAQEGAGRHEIWNQDRRARHDPGSAFW